MSIQLEFVGHACFRIWQDGRPIIVTDPSAPDVLGVPDKGAQLDADTIIVSSLTDAAHANLGLVKGNPRVINALDVSQGKEEVALNGETLITVAAAEDPNHPRGPQDNALYAFKVDDVWFMHMGDLGYRLSDEDLAPFANHCDVLMALTGENLTPSHDDLDPMFEFLQPKWIVPMHYGMPPLTFEMSNIDKFLDHRDQNPAYLVRHHTVSLPLPHSDLGRSTIVVLKPSGFESNEE